MVRVGRRSRGRRWGRYCYSWRERSASDLEHLRREFLKERIFRVLVRIRQVVQFKQFGYYSLNFNEEKQGCDLSYEKEFKQNEI